MQQLTRQEAKRQGNKRYLGKFCPYGHRGLRYVSSASCVDCVYSIAPTKSLKRRARRRRDALQLIMDAHGIQGCHFKIHPNMPAKLKKHECWGKLTFEHPNGVGRKCDRRKIIGDLLSNKQNPKDLMVLCTSHQIWNADNVTVL